MTRASRRTSTSLPSTAPRAGQPRPSCGRRSASRTHPAAVDPHVPELGEHTEQVLLEAGYSWEDIATLSAAGAV